MKWAKQFYKEQFLMVQEDFEQINKSYYEEDVRRIEEQFGKPFSTVLELGAGNGYLANELATRGKMVTTIELVEELARFAEKHKAAPVRIFCDDYYTIQLHEKFDCLLYIDGFGVGEDEDQLRLLKRIYEWLGDDGYALVDIYEPNYWRSVYKGELKPSMDSSVIRQYSFDETNNRMIDTWRRNEDRATRYTQSLKCYSPEQIVSLCEEANLEIVAYFPGGAMDFETWSYSEVAKLNHCISYRVKLKKKMES